MEKQAIIKKLLSRGVMVTPQALEQMKEDEARRVLQQDGESECAVVKDVKDERLRCSMNTGERPEKMSPEDAIKANNRRYDTLRGILLTKADAVSINNIGRGSTKLCVVGLVKEKKPEGFILEDSTGEIEVRSKESVDLDDVIAVKGWPRENVLFGDEIIYPDIPMSRDINVMDSTILLTSEYGATQHKADVVLTPDTLIWEGKERRTTNPAWVYLEKKDKKVVVLVYRSGETIDKATAVSWLKKRYIGAENDPITNNDSVMGTVPDILWLISENEPWAENYKGVTVICFGRRKHALVDLKTRKVEIV